MLPTGIKPDFCSNAKPATMKPQPVRKSFFSRLVTFFRNLFFRNKKQRDYSAIQAYLTGLRVEVD